MISTKRIYESPAVDDGQRILVDRLWPRGIKKDQANLDLWLKDVAPSDELRKWFGHDPGKWSRFRERYFKELEERDDSLEEIVKRAEKGRVTLLYGAKDRQHNNAEALKAFLEKNYDL